LLGWYHDLVWRRPTLRIPSKGLVTVVYSTCATGSSNCAYYINLPVQALQLGEENTSFILLNISLYGCVCLRALLEEYRLLSNYSEFGRHGYCVIHGANYTFYVTNIYLNWILRFDWLYHPGGSSTSTIYYGYQTHPFCNGAGAARISRDDSRSIKK